MRWVLGPDEHTHCQEVLHLSLDLEELDPFVDLPIFPEDFNKARGTRRRVGLIVAVIVFIMLFDAPMSINNMNGNGVGFYWLA